jgi:hypothetical protein
VCVVVGKRRKRGPEVLDAPVDFAARIGVRSPSGPLEAAPEPVRRVDGPIESDRATRGRSLMIGANETPARPAEIREQARPASGAVWQPVMTGREQAFAAPSEVPMPDPEPGTSEPAAYPTIARTREAPSAGEMDLVVMPLPTPDDWHHFELALRRVPGVGPLRTEYYRAGILKLRLRWSGAHRFALAVANVPGYRVGILGEDRATVQIRVTRA